LKTLTNALNQTTTFNAYDAAGRVTTITNEASPLPRTVG